MTTELVVNVGPAYLETFGRSPDAGSFGIEDGGFVNVARSNEAVLVLEVFLQTHHLVLNYLVSTYAMHQVESALWSRPGKDCGSPYLATTLPVSIVISECVDSESSRGKVRLVRRNQSRVSCKAATEVVLQGFPRGVMVDKIFFG